MTTLAQLRAKGPRIKMLGVGVPKSGKTGSLAALMNTGRYKWRVIDLDGHFFESVEPFLDPKVDIDLDVWRFDQDIRLTKAGGDVISTVGVPSMYGALIELAKEWKYKDRDGAEVNLGRLRDWGRDTILVLDPLSSLNDAAMLQTLFAQNRLEEGPMRRHWGIAASLEEGYVAGLCSSFREHHVVVLAHERLLGPEEPPDDPKRASAAHDERVRITLERNRHLEWRTTASAVGKSLSSDIAHHFNVVVQYKTQVRGTAVQRVIQCQPSEDMLTAVPALNIPKTLPVETGLVDLFGAITGFGKPTVATKE